MMMMMAMRMIIIIEMMMTILKWVENLWERIEKCRKEEKNERLKDKIRDERIDIENESYLK